MDETAQASKKQFVRITDEAARWIGIFLTEQKLNPAEYAFRVGVKAGGCSGYEYVMRMDRPKDTDSVFEHAGSRVVVDEKSLRLLNGSTLHFLMKYQGAGFTVMSPRVAASCGCGSSVSFKKDDSIPTAMPSPTPAGSAPPAPQVPASPTPAGSAPPAPQVPASPTPA